jgi:molybdopterin synthase catalytic subunit
MAMEGASAVGLPCDIVASPIELERLIAAVRTDACGAVVAFLGVVREFADDDRAVDGLSYEAYPEMALPELQAIAAEASQRFGDASVAVAVASKHRAVAFDACEYVIDELKRRVPIWKKEHYRDGEASWRANAGGSPARA